METIAESGSVRPRHWGTAGQNAEASRGSPLFLLYQRHQLPVHEDRSAPSVRSVRSASLSMKPAWSRMVRRRDEAWTSAWAVKAFHTTTSIELQ